MHRIKIIEEFKSNSFVYCIENLKNKKRYIGITYDIKLRYNYNKNKKSFKYKHHNKLLNIDLDLGYQFKFYVLEYLNLKELNFNDRNAHMLNREVFYIKKLNTNFNNGGFGYNFNNGGDYIEDSQIKVYLLNRKNLKKLKVFESIKSCYKYLKKKIIQ